MLETKPGTPGSCAMCAGVALLAASALLFGEPQRHDGFRNGRAKAPNGRPETITGRLTMIRPEDGIVVLVRTGPAEPSETQLSWTETRDPTTNGVEKSPVTVSQASGETDYAFRISPQTRIEVDGRRISMEGLKASRGRQATVRFLAKRTGDVAVEIRVSR